ncbi:MAG: hypothetical protein K8S16_04425 [Bacteroidales bacterium]|nr:hypothetical protein [Bacteroidales bacterium]
MRKKLFLLTKYFWKTTFFTPTYQAKFNYSNQLYQLPEQIGTNNALYG